MSARYRVRRGRVTGWTVVRPNGDGYARTRRWWSAVKLAHRMNRNVR